MCISIEYTQLTPSSTVIVSFFFNKIKQAKRKHPKKPTPQPNSVTSSEVNQVCNSYSINLILKVLLALLPLFYRGAATHCKYIICPTPRDH